MNPHFRKGNKAKHGSGHLWVLADLDNPDEDLCLRPPPTASEAARPGEEDDEAARAVRSILGQNEIEAENTKNKNNRSNSVEEADKENSGATRRSSARLSQNSNKPDPSIKSPEEMVRAIKRSVGCVEVQYVETESRLDAPGKAKIM